MKNLLLLLLLFNFGCASYQPGYNANIISGDQPANVPITGELDRKLTTDHYAVINFSFVIGNSVIFSSPHRLFC